MGLLPELMRTGYKPREVRLVDERGQRVGGFSPEVFRRVTKGRFLSIPRGDLAAALHRAASADRETVFGDSITTIEETGDALQVSFLRSSARRFDLVIGADGLHSNVRRLAFGSQDRFERYLGYEVAAFAARAYPVRDPTLT